jgi:hypothetical protein
VSDVLTIAKLFRWSINYYNDTANAVGRAGEKDLQRLPPSRRSASNFCTEPHAGRPKEQRDEREDAVSKAYENAA